MNSFYLIGLWDHLWQSTLFLLGVGGITLLLRKNSARVRCVLWLAASAKFLVPFACLTAIGAWIPRPLVPIHGTEPAFVLNAGQKVSQILQFGGPGLATLAPATYAAHHGNTVLIVLGVIWALGTLIVAAHWYARWTLVRCALRKSEESSLTFVIPVRWSPSQLEPAVVGIFRTVLLLPKGIEQRLYPEELRAVLAHEQCHLAWRDNLAATLHMLVEALFWFHPLVWWVGGRIVEERERACDEHVLAGGHSPGTYAEGILKVCDHYLESRLACVSGVGGASLNQRVERIMKNGMIARLSAVRKLAITLAFCLTVVVPIGIGVLTSPGAQAQAVASTSAEPVFRNVSIQIGPAGWKNAPEGTLGVFGLGAGISVTPGGRVIIAYSSLRDFIADAYDVSQAQVVGRNWSREPHYDISADNPVSPQATREEQEAFSRAIPGMFRNLLTKNLGLVVKRERKQVDGYVLAISSRGSRLKPYAGVPSWKTAKWMSPEEGVDATGYPVSTLVDFLQHMLKVPVVDQTGLQGIYEYKASWKPSSAGAALAPADIAKALEEQLGLRLEAKTLTVDVVKVASLKSPDKMVTPSADLLTINFKDADIIQVAEAVVRATHKSLIIDPRAHVQLTITSSVPMSPAQFYEAFMAALKEHGLVAVPHGNAIQIQPDAHGIDSSPAIRKWVHLDGAADLEELRATNLNHYLRARKILAAANENCKAGPGQTYLARFARENPVCQSMFWMTSNPPKKQLSFQLDDVGYIALVSVMVSGTFGN